MQITVGQCAIALSWLKRVLLRVLEHLTYSNTLT